MELISSGVLRTLRRLQLHRVNIEGVHKLCMHCSAVHRQDVGEKSGTPAFSKSQKISRAMEAYIKQAANYEKRLKEATEEYELGKRHLANIMGQDPDTFTKDDINKAINYLLPSGLTNKKARPMMQHPLELFPKVKAAQFGLDGRPHHFLFYTGKPHFYKLMYDISWKVEALKNLEEKPLQKSSEEVTMKEELQGSRWVTFNEFRQHFDEKLTEHDFKRFLVLMERLVSYKHAIKEKVFINQYRQRLQAQSAGSETKTYTDDQGRNYSLTFGKRKTAKAAVKLFHPGTGQFVVNDQDISYFSNIPDREQVLFPLQFTDMVGRVDVDVRITGSGSSSQAGAIRYATSLALLPFINKAVREQMRLVGLLTPDPRRRERKKAGQPGARKKFTWKKR